MIGFLLLVSLTATAAELCVTGYNDTTCKNRIATAVECSPVQKGCIALGSGSKRTTCGNNKYTVSVYSTPDCTGSDISTDTPLNECIPGSMGGKPGVEATIATCGSCFSLDDTAELSDGRTLPFGSLREGDRVLAVDSSGQLVFSPVFRIGDRSEHPTTFNRITVSTGAYIDVTDGHFIFGRECCSLDSSIRSETVRVGDMLWVREGDAIVQRAVTSVAPITKTGSINPHTLAGSIVANGIVATHFTAETTWRWKNLAPYWYAVVHAFTKVIPALF